MRGKIFISYRRDDAAGDARSIRDGLARKFGRANVFMDVDNLLAGQRFDRELAKALERCDVLIAVIGPRFMDLLAGKSAGGERDYVREEIAAALRRGIVVIPVLVGQQGRMPSLPRAADLPEDIRDLVQHQKHDVMHEHFGRDLADLIAAISIVQRGERNPPPWRSLAAVAAAVLLLLGAGVLAYQSGMLAAWTDSGAAQRAAEAQRKAAEEADKKRAEAEAKRDPGLSVTPGSGKSFRDKTADGQPCPLCPEMVVIPSGSFTMGSPVGEKGRDDGEGPQHPVTIAGPLAVGKYAITRGEFSAFVREAAYKIESGCFGYAGSEWKLQQDLSWQSPGFDQNDRHPVVCVSWSDARAFAAWLSQKSGRPYRLLTEAEWEYAARAGSTTQYFFGDDERDFCRYGNGADQTAKKTFPGWLNVLPCSDGYVYTAPVGSFLPNKFGLYDMLGNSSQWVEDCSHANYDGAPGDGSAWTSGDCSHPVLRGGPWSAFPRILRSADRSANSIDYRSGRLGIRVVRTLTP